MTVSFVTADCWFLHWFTHCALETSCVQSLSCHLRASDFLRNVPWSSIHGRCTTSSIFSFHQSGPLKAPSTACRQVHVLHANCHQCAINGTGSSRPTTESREDPVVLPQNWQTHKRLENLDRLLLPNIISIFTSVSFLSVGGTAKFLRDHYENFGLLLSGMFLILVENL